VAVAPEKTVKGGPLVVIAAVLTGASYFVFKQFQPVWPWQIIQWSNLSLLLEAGVTGVGWLGWGALSLRWLNRRRQLGPGR
jgi:hypothetical protein